MTARLLPRDEWIKLIPMWDAISAVNSDALEVVVVEDAVGDIVGCWGLITLAHVEGIWIRDDHRKAGAVLRKLWRKMRELTGARHIERVITGAETPEVSALLTAMKAEALPHQFLLSMERSA